MPKTLYFDIETSPNIGHIWSLWKQNVSLSQLQENGRTLCWAAKWAGQKKVEFRSEHHDGHEAMVTRAWELFDEADFICHYNGKRFDTPTMNKEFLKYGGIDTPPSPFKEIDLLESVKKVFRFPSNKLDYVSQFLGLAGKAHHEGHELWVKCLAGQPQAWKTMRKYNIQDVKLLEEVHARLLPWLKNVPNMGLYVDNDAPTCPHCGGTHIQKRGFAYTTVSKFQQYACMECGGWSRARINVMSKESKENVLTFVR